jgi:phenylacetic acid degradation operon negative regulatory protein
MVTSPTIAGEAVQPQDLAITLLGAFVRPQPRAVWSGGMVQLLEEFGFSTTAARAALSRLVRRGLLHRLRRGRLVFYEITERCDELLEEGDRRIFSLGRSDGWDGSWTVVWHSIPQERRLQRARFGRRLRFLGFGSVQDGTWISPSNREREVHAIVEELDVAGDVGVLIGRPAADLHIDQLIKRGWDLAALDERYSRFVAEFEPHRKPAPASLGEREAFMARTSLVHAFRQFPFMDPGLPDELMPSKEIRRQAVASFHDVYAGLREPAQRYFERVAMANIDGAPGAAKRPRAPAPTER